WLLKIESKDGKSTAAIVSAFNKGFEKISKLEDFQVAKGYLRFAVKLPKKTLQFEFKLPEQPGKILKGSFTDGANVTPAHLEAPKATSVDLFDVNKEIVTRKETGPDIFNALLNVLGQAEDRKVSADDAKKWSARVYKDAEAYGASWQRRLAENIARTLAEQDGY